MSALTPTIELGSQWPPIGIEPINPFELPMLNTVILLSSGATVTYAHHSIIQGKREGALYGSVATILLAIIFTGLTLINILFPHVYHLTYLTLSYIYSYKTILAKQIDCSVNHFYTTKRAFSSNVTKRLYTTNVDVKEANLSPYWVTGFADAESTFSLKVSKSSTTRSPFGPGPRIGPCAWSWAEGGWKNLSPKNLFKRLYSTTNIQPKIDPYWVTGFCDGESCFSLKVFKKSTSKVGWGVIPNFSIQLHIKDVILLRRLHSFFGVGTIYVKENNNTVTYAVQSLRDITNIIIPHFDKYPLITNKKADYLLFKQGINLLNLKAHFGLDGLREILSIKAAMNTENLSDMLKSHFPNIIPIKRPEVSFECIPNPYWFTGFVDAEGNFFADTSKARANDSFYTQISFSLSQHVRDELLFTKFIDYLGCGRIVKASKRPNGVLFIVNKFTDIQTKVIPFFHNYPLLGVKSMDYIDFCEIAKIIDNKSHLTPEGLKKIRSLKSGMNSGRIFNN